jgi:hypothetical protein
MMQYRDGTVIRLRDIVQLTDGRTAEVVALLKSGQFSEKFCREDWPMFSSGVLVRTENGGIEHFPETDEELVFVEHPKKKGRFRRWWDRPSRPGDRAMSGLLGAWAGLWIGGLGILIFGPPLGLWGILGFAFAGSVLVFCFGMVFPKASRLVTTPFAFFWIGGGGST